VLEILFVQEYGDDNDNYPPSYLSLTLTLSPLILLGVRGRKGMGGKGVRGTMEREGKV